MITTSNGQVSIYDIIIFLIVYIPKICQYIVQGLSEICPLLNYQCIPKTFQLRKKKKTKRQTDDLGGTSFVLLFQPSRYAGKSNTINPYRIFSV